MTTTSEAITRLSSVLGLSEVWLAELGKRLRGGGDGLWPTGGVGGGRKAAHVELHHLRNIIIAAGATSHVPDVIDVVSAYSKLVSGPVGGKKETDNPLDSCFAPKRTLAASIDALILSFAEENKARAIRDQNAAIHFSRTWHSVQVLAQPVGGKGLELRAAFGVDLLRQRVSELRIEANLFIQDTFEICALMAKDSAWVRDQAQRLQRWDSRKKP